MVVALVALFVSTGGTTYAVHEASEPERRLARSRLKKGAVRSENIARGAVTASKLAKGLVQRPSRRGRSGRRSR